MRARHRLARGRPGLRGACFALVLVASCEIRFGSEDLPPCGECRFDNAAVICESKSCVMGPCSRGFGDCNFEKRDGCETNLLLDSWSCGACYASCDQGCYSGACGVPEEIANGPASRWMPFDADDEFVYWATSSAAFSGLVLRAPKRGGSLGAIATSVDRILSLRVVVDHVYWLERGGSDQSPSYRVRRMHKHATEGRVQDVGGGPGLIDQSFVISGDFVYLDVRDGAERIVRLPVAGGEPEPIPGFDRAEVVWGLQRHGENLVFGVRWVDNPTPVLVEYSPADTTHRVLSESFNHSVFRVAGDTVYVKYDYLGGGWALHAIDLSAGKASIVGNSRIDFQEIVVLDVPSQLDEHEASFVLVNSVRGSLSRLFPRQEAGEVLIGEQLGLVNVASDESWLYYAADGAVWSVPR